MFHLVLHHLVVARSVHEVTERGGMAEEIVILFAIGTDVRGSACRSNPHQRNELDLEQPA